MSSIGRLDASERNLTQETAPGGRKLTGNNTCDVRNENHRANEWDVHEGPRGEDSEIAETRGPDTSVARRPDTLRPRPETRGAGFTAIATSQSRDELCVRIRYRNSSSQTWTSTGLLMASKRFVGFV
ncbi:Hypothetical protein SMAX5B_019548 [Scophthalmus maximus]|uniref:Uncharacterized protein n=1 Tax=Scophthalmus maximus TaxID=52904 RepID=A0A2U9C3J9_SCOMX|nr:Hypothetical protein SMAX5B_019548 [Scophthalmus maximus]